MTGSEPDDERQPALPDPAAVDTAVQLFSALAHPVRLTMVVALHRHGPMAAGQLQQLVGIEQSAASHQLRVLRRARLVHAQRDGRRMVYRVTDAHVAHIVADALVHVAEPDHAKPRS